MNHNAAITTTLTIGPPAVIIVVNPYMFYFTLAVLMVTCTLVCVHIINNCAKRERRIDALTTRAIRRAHARNNTASE